MNLKLRAIAVVAGLLLLVASVTVARAQSVGSSVQGVVTDSSGALVPGADIRLTNMRTGVVLTTISDASGNYAFPTVQPGTYSLAVSKQGFAAYNLRQFSVEVGLRAAENATLNMASTAETVTVQANGLANLLETESNDPSVGAARFYADRSNTDSLAAVSTVSLIAGGVALAAGVVLVATAPRSKQAGWVRFAPSVGQGGGGAVAVGEF